MTSDLRDLYQEVIIGHSRHPQNFREIEDATDTVEGVNPLCGDQLTLYLKVVDRRIEDIAFRGTGCAISMASASLMTGALLGKDESDALKLFDRVHELLTDGEKDDHSVSELGKLAALSGVSEYPMRVKCATLVAHLQERARAVGPEGFNGVTMERDPYQPINLRRAVAVTLIPGGQKMDLAQDDVVFVMQALGGTFTVQTQSGYLARINADDADALGLKAEDAGAAPKKRSSDDGPFDLEQVTDELKAIFDPEIPVNIVDLGLIFGCESYELPDGSHRVEVKMSMTAPGCGMGDVLADDARARIQAIPGVSEVDIELVWDPPWVPTRMSDAAKLELGML